MTIWNATDGAVYEGSSGSYDAARRALMYEGPGKRTVAFPADGVSFSSQFDGGSLGDVALISTDEFVVTIPEDASASGLSTGYTTWFYFEVLVDARGPPADRSDRQRIKNKTESTGSTRELSITLANMNNQRGLYGNGYTILHCVMDASGDQETRAEREDIELFFENERKWLRLATPLDVQKYTHTTPAKTSAANNNSDREGNGKPKTETKMKLAFMHHVRFPRERVRFAFCYPFTYTKIQRQLAALEGHVANNSESIYFHRDVLTHSLGGLPIELVTISSTDAMLETYEPRLPGLYPKHGQERPRSFDLTKKRTVLITARVHPGETPANFLLDGMLRLLCHATDERARLLRRQFVFKIIPVLNPDGVCQGFYRTDLRGVNLNRVYEDPQRADEPAVFASKALLLHTVERYGRDTARERVVFVDLHAHSNHRGCFVYGNRLVPDPATHGSQASDWTRQVQTQLYAKLASLHSAYFDYGACSFDAQNMTRHDLRDNRNAPTSRAGSSRVGLFSATDLTYVYTIECNYNEGRRRLETSTQRTMPKPKAVEIRTMGATKSDKACSIQRPAAPLGTRLFIKYTPAEWMDVGMGCLLALLDLFQVAPSRDSLGSSVLADSPYRTLAGAKKSILSDFKAEELGNDSTSSSQPPTKSTGAINTLSVSKAGPQRNTLTPMARSALSKY